MSIKFKQFKVTWQQKPYAYNPKRVVFVRAQTDNDARVLAEDHIERQGLEKSEFSVIAVADIVPLPPGEVLGD
jgi:hypothetical protein